ncbi:MAG: hypothetical protein SF051_07905 [Elusimicrobiota bacterium]|nr:hypothetical protein [Elusimicrobiota bacterium]
MRTIVAALCAALLLAATPAAAQEAADDAPKAPLVRAGGRRVSGSGGYKGRSGFVQVGREWRVRAGYSDYTFDSTTATTRTGSLKVAYQGEQLSLGANASVTPLSENYRGASWGLDAGWAFLPEDPDSLVEEWELNGWWTQTRHHQTVPGNVIRPRRDLDIHQHDLGVGASITALKATLSGDFYFSNYFFDEFDLLLAASRNQPRLGAAVALVNGFPRNGGSARLDLELVSWITPFVAMSATSYKLAGNPPSRSVSAGANLKAGPVGLEVSYERVRQSGIDDTKYLTLGGSVRF